MNIQRKLSNGKEESIEFSTDALFSIFDKARKYESLLKLPRHDMLACSFCGKSHEDVLKLVAGPRVYICNECVDLCTEILDLAQSAIKATESHNEVEADKLPFTDLEIEVNE